MKRTIIALLALCALTQGAHAYDFDYTDSEEIAAFGPGRGDDRRGDDRRGDDRRGNNGRGNNGPGRPGNGPGYPGNGPGHGGPGNGGPHNPRPQPPRPQPRVEFVTCESQGNRYNTCYVDPRGIRNFYLSKQRSSARCEQNRSFGLTGDRIWVDHGCRGVFAIERY